MMIIEYIMMVVYVYLHITLPHYHHYAGLSECIELLKCLSDIFCLECVSKVRSVLLIIFHAIYEAVCIQFIHFCNDDYDKTCTWSYYHHQIRSMTHFFFFFFFNLNDISPGSSHPSIQCDARSLTGDLPTTAPLTTDLWILKTLA